MESKSREVLYQECEVMSVFAFGLNGLHSHSPLSKWNSICASFYVCSLFPLFPFHKIFINNNNEGFCMPQDEKERERESSRPEKEPKSW